MVQQEQMKVLRRTSGFSLIEIVVVMMIVGLMVGVGLPYIFRQLRGSYAKKTKILLPTMKAVLTEYHSDMSQYPARLEDLLVRPTDPKLAARWHQYVDSEKELEDAWGNQFFYKRNPSGPGSSKRPFELYSWGPDGEGSTEGQISVWDI